MPDFSDSAEQVAQYAGKQLRRFRLSRGFSQKELGACIGVSFQQIQKYERGTNAMNVVRLYALAETLAVSPSAFFPDERIEPPVVAANRQDEAYSLALMRHYHAIPDVATRRLLVALIRRIGSM